jgi:hypothetical protein
MLGRRFWLKSTLMSFLAVLPGRRLVAQQGNSFNAAERLDERHITSLHEQLTKGLRVVSPEQQQFVKVVVAHVDQGVLPRAMVNLVYKWALERNPKFPFPYFEYSLRTLAQRRGITL